jgi:hypothetical protein
MAASSLLSTSSFSMKPWVKTWVLQGSHWLGTPASLVTQDQNQALDRVAALPLLQAGKCRCTFVCTIAMKSLMNIVKRSSNMFQKFQVVQWLFNYRFFYQLIKAANKWLSNIRQLSCDIIILQ